MRVRFISVMAVCVALSLCLVGNTFAQTGNQTKDLSPHQRLEVMRSKLDTMRRSLNSAINSLPTAAGDKDKPNPDDPRERLRGLDKEVGSILSEVNDVRGRQERAERYDATVLDRLEASVADIDLRVQAGLQATAGARSSTAATTAAAPAKKKKKGKFFGLFGGDEGKYEDLTGTVAPGRDRVLFEEAAKQVRKGSHDTGRLLFTTIINTYPDSPFLSLAKLAIADSFYLEGTTSALIQAAQAYQDWLTFFPTDPLADDAMLKVAEAEMRQMGLADRDITHARKAEQRLKVLLQQFPQSQLRPYVQERLNEVQENLAMHNLQIGNFYYKVKYETKKGGLKGAQSRYKEIVEKYPNFSYMDEVLFRLATTYQQEEEPDEAAKYYQQILRDHPNSEFGEKARDQLNIIGATIPEANPERKNAVAPERPGFVGTLMQEIIGRPNVNTSKDGILISRDSKEGGDLIDEALKNNGELPSNVMPKAPVQRTNPPQKKAAPPPVGAAAVQSTTGTKP